MAPRIKSNAKAAMERRRVYAACQYLLWVDFDQRMTDFDRKQVPIMLGYVIAFALKQLEQYAPYSAGSEE